MPELAEVAYFAKRWEQGIGDRVERVHVNGKARIFRDVDTGLLTQMLKGQSLISVEASAKQMLFRFSDDVWLGVHLGMTGRLMVGFPEMVPAKHEHLVLFQAKRALVFSDYRMFGKVELGVGKAVPEWWAKLPPAILSEGFTREKVGAFCARRKRSPIKAILLMQEVFPGIGNWMADEILWRAGIDPRCLAGKLSDGPKLTELFETIQEVTADALREIAEDGRSMGHGDEERVERLPDSWLFNHRWKPGGNCPKTGELLMREKIGGRTTCFSAEWQDWRG